MNEAEFQLKKLWHLLQAYVELCKLSAEPGDKAFMLNQRINWLERQIREILR